ncbi:MAG: efflux RND transporter periplasmic adaptor subunit, partial [Myxococcota bacterium]
ARAQYQLNLRTDRRVRSLAKERFASAQRADEARFGAEVAGQSVEELEASLQSLQIDLEKAVLRAPYRGRIARRLLDEGTVVGVGTPVFELMSREGKEVSVGVTLEAFRTLEIGEELEVRIDGVRGAGRVTQLIHQIDPRSRTARVILALPAQADATEGQVADVVLPVRHTDPGFWVPISALRPGPEGLWTLLLVEGASAPNRAWLTPQPISILHFDGERAYAAGPLEDGQSVVKSGHHRLVPGQLVEPIAALEVTP